MGQARHWRDDGSMSQSRSQHLLIDRERAPLRQKAITVLVLRDRFSGALAYALESALRDPATIRAIRVDETTVAGPNNLPIPVGEVVGDASDCLKHMSANCDLLVVECPTTEFEQVTNPVLVDLRRDTQCLLVEVDGDGKIIRASGPEGWSFSAPQGAGAMTPMRPVVVVGVDGSLGSDAAIRWARSAALNSGWSLRLVAAYSDETTRNRLQRSLKLVQKHDADPVTEIVVRKGHPVDILVEQSAGAEMLVVGRHGTASLVHSAMGGVGDSCARLADCPVVAVPATWTAPSRAAHSGNVPAQRPDNVGEWDEQR